MPSASCERRLALYLKMADTFMLGRRVRKQKELEALSQGMPDLWQENALLKLRRRIAFWKNMVDTLVLGGQGAHAEGAGGAVAEAMYLEQGSARLSFRNVWPCDQKQNT